MRYLWLLPLLLLLSVSVRAEDGLITKKSHYPVSVTLDKLEVLLKKKGIGIVVRWNHGARADAVGIALRPTEILIFGNPKMGSHLMSANPVAGIDLPMKVLAWQDEKDDVYLTYNDPAYIAGRHQINDRDKIFLKMSNVLNTLTSIATGNQ